MNFEPMSYFFGVVLGDGNVQYDEKNHKYSVTLVGTDTDILYRAHLQPNLVFSDILQPRFYTEERKGKLTVYRVRWYGKLFAEFMFRITYAKQNIPDFVWTASRESRMEILAGLMDTDGGISLSRDKYYKISFANTCTELAKDFFRLCESLNIKVNYLGMDEPV